MIMIVTFLYFYVAGFLEYRLPQRREQDGQGGGSVRDRAGIGADPRRHPPAGELIGKRGL